MLRPFIFLLLLSVPIHAVQYDFTSGWNLFHLFSVRRWLWRLILHRLGSTPKMTLQRFGIMIRVPVGNLMCLAETIQEVRALTSSRLIRVTGC